MNSFIINKNSNRVINTNFQPLYNNPVIAFRDYEFQSIDLNKIYDQEERVIDNMEKELS